MIQNETTSKAGERTRHTPGPWLVNPTGDVGQWCIGRTDVPIATVETELPDKIWKANARLIAKSPELFAFVKDYFDQADCGNGGEHTEIDNDKAANCWHCMARRLVESVEGKS